MDGIAIESVLKHQYQAGLRDGAAEAFASMVVHGYCHIGGRKLDVRFAWPIDPRFQDQVWEQCAKIMPAAYEAGRQANPPPCCWLHGPSCEAPSELCCAGCDKASA